MSQRNLTFAEIVDIRVKKFEEYVYICLYGHGEENKRIQYIFKLERSPYNAVIGRCKSVYKRIKDKLPDEDKEVFYKRFIIYSFVKNIVSNYLHGTYEGVVLIPGHETYIEKILLSELKDFVKDSDLTVIVDLFRHYYCVTKNLQWH